MRTIAAASGPEHCGWQSAVLLFVDWPPASGPASPSNSREYVRDPAGVVTADLQAGFRAHARVPASARRTPYLVGTSELWIDDDGGQFAYAVDTSYPWSTERWPRSDPMVLCA